MGKSIGSAVSPADDYAAESDHSTLQRAQEIQAAPPRMKAVRAFHAKKVKSMQGVGKMLGGKKSTMGGGGRF